MAVITRRDVLQLVAQPQFQTKVTLNTVVNQPGPTGPAGPDQLPLHNRSGVTFHPGGLQRGRQDHLLLMLQSRTVSRQTRYDG